MELCSDIILIMNSACFKKIFFIIPHCGTKTKKNGNSNDFKQRPIGYYF
jgi:hypothetical protein